MNKKKFPSELRFDIVSEDWVVVATGRAKKPETFKKEKRQKRQTSLSKCPFCNIKTQKKPTLIFSKGKEVKSLDDWTIVSIPNKYPAFMPSSSLNERKEGKFYKIIDANGFHEVVVTKNHKKQIAQFSEKEIKEVIDVYQSRYLDLMKNPFVNYISIFHNHGVEAGASIVHPHSQIIAIPLIDSDLKKSISNSRSYFKKNKKCIYCEMSKWELKKKTRIVFQNKDFIVLCPFASKSSFQMIISPKKHLSYFERITEKEKKSLAQAFSVALKKLNKGLNDPAYNFYLHSAPCDGKKYDFYHWHWTILPKTSIQAGFEMGAMMEILTIAPEQAAKYLKRQ